MDGGQERQDARIGSSMRLKRVKVFGFKTFADKTEFDVDGELIAVVGSNGCGKSNLVDAILWGLGEGSAKQLRAQTGTDVIFNGSSKRKPIGYAEVSLYFDNEDGSLPVPTAEVVVTRRLTRSGESEYSINRQNCRLRDVLELLADSGLGRAGYAIVGQKEIDQALAASAEDRRAWVDEAAGVQRYRARKIEALRKLASAREHLARVHDILHEIESQREPLRAEAEVAKRYKAALEALRAVESGLLIVDVANAVGELASLDASLKNSRHLIGEETARAENLEQRLDEIGQEISRLESEMDSVRATQQSAMTQLERAEAAIQLGEQRLAAFDELEASLGEETEHADRRLAEIQIEIDAMAAEALAERAAFETVTAECSGAGEEARKLSRSLSELEAKLAEGRRMESERIRAEAESAQRNLRCQQVQREIDGIVASLPSLEASAEEARAALEAAELALAETASNMDALAAARREKEKSLSEHAQHVRRWMAERASLDGRRRGIEATIEMHEGLAHGPRAVLEAAGRSEIEGDFLPVGEAIEVPKDLALAIEIALGNSAQDLITSDDRFAKAAVDYLKRHRAGRATFQPIPLMRPSHVPDELRDLLRQPGVLGLASELVECAPAHRPVLDSLLGRAVVVQDLDRALQLAKTAGWNRLVTLEGELVHHRGAVTGGASVKSHYGLVQRKADLREVVDELEKLDEELASSEAVSSRLQAEIDEASELLSKLIPQSNQQKTEVEEARRWAASVQEELQSTTRSLQRLRSEMESLSSHQAALFDSVDLAALEAERDGLLRAFAARSADAERAEARIREAESRARSAEDKHESAIRKLAHARETEAHRLRKIERIAPERLRAASEMERAAEDRAKASALAAESTSRLERFAAERKASLEESFQLNEELKASRANLQSIAAAAHQAELDRARLDAKRANSMQRLMEEYGLTEDDAVAQAPGIELPPDAAQATSRLRREIRAMGDVNVGAIEAYDRLTSRADELAAQRADVEGGIAEVEASIRELDKLTRSRFQSTFEGVQTAFAEIFGRLFQGGEGRIFLTDEDNLLESGIDIDVQLPGKKRQRLELLSGGERSLCATAFLFALLKVKPSPLVVLDEVDAPLDGRNVEKFIDLLREFGSTIQFIVITHNPATIEAAPVWLGVTMSEPGVSTLVPVKMRTESYAALA